MLKQIAAVGVFALLSCAAWGQVETEIKAGESSVRAITMGEGEHAVIALHGAGGNDRRFFFGENGGQMGQSLAQAGFRVIAVTWSGEPGGGFNEVAAAVAHAKETGAKKVSLMGHSRGGELAANYARQQPDATFDTVIQFSSVDDKGLPLAQTKKLFAYNKYDKWAKWQGDAFDKSAEIKKKIELGGSGHPVKALIGEKADLAQDVIGLLKQ